MSVIKRCGCASKKRCEHPWHVEFMVNGQSFRQSTGTPDWKLARDIEAEMRSRAVRGRFKLPLGQSTTLAAFWPTYWESYALIKHKASTQVRTERCWRALAPVLGAKLLGEISGEAMGKFASLRLAEGWKPGNVNRELAVLSGILAKAVEWGYIDDKPAIPFLKVDNARTRILSEVDLARLLAYYKQHEHYAIVALLTITGARESEILKLTWPDVEGDYLVFRETKNGKPRALPQTEDIRSLIMNREKVSPYVFPSPVTPKRPLSANAFYTTFKRAVRALGLGEDVVPHTLRHTAASRIVAAGHDLRTAQEILGHSTLAMLQRYTHPLEAAKRAALTTPFTLGQQASA